MKFFALLFVTSGVLVAQTSEKDILDIRNKYNEIQTKLDSFDTREIYELNWSVEGGDAIVYHKDNEVYMIRAFWFGEMGKGVYEYYFSEGNLIFAFYTDYRYNRPFYYDEEAAKENDDEPFDESKTVISESRYYFKDEVLFRWLDGANKVTNTADYVERQKETLELADELLKRFNK